MWASASSKTIDLAVYSFSDTRLRNALTKAAKRGVKIRAIINGTCLDYAGESFMAGSDLGDGFLLLNGVRINIYGEVMGLEHRYAGNSPANATDPKHRSGWARRFAQSGRTRNAAVAALLRQRRRGRVHVAFEHCGRRRAAR